MDKKSLIIEKFIIPLFVCVLFVPLVASAGGHGGMTSGMAMGGYSGQTMMGTMNYGYGSFSSSINQAAWNMGSLGLFPTLGYGSLSTGYGSLYPSYPGTSRFGSYLTPTYGMSYGSTLSGFPSGYGYGYSWGGSMGGSSMGSGSIWSSSMEGHESGYGSLAFSTSGSGTSSGSDRTGASYSGQQSYGAFPILNPLMYGFFVGWI